MGTLDLRTITLYFYDWDLSILEFQTFYFYFVFKFLLFVCVALRGQKSMKKQHLRIQEGHFLKSALNLDLTLPDDGECPALLISCGIIDLGAFCVELWSFFVSKRISVLM